MRNNGFRAEVRGTENERLKAFRRNIYFPELFFELGLTTFTMQCSFWHKRPPTICFLPNDREFTTCRNLKKQQ